MADNPVKRFADYSNADLTQLAIELEKSDDDRLLGVLAEVRSVLERRDDSHRPGLLRRFETRLFRRLAGEQ